MKQRSFPFSYSRKIEQNLLLLIKYWWCNNCGNSPEGCAGCKKNIDDPHEQPTHFKEKEREKYG